VYRTHVACSLFVLAATGGQRHDARGAPINNRFMTAASTATAGERNTDISSRNETPRTHR
jgi:hypothetical protein